MTYIAKFYSLETWEIEQETEYETLNAVKDAANGRVYEVEVLRTHDDITWSEAFQYAAFYLWLLFIGFCSMLLLGYFVR